MNNLLFIIRYCKGFIELKSEYHYWLLIKNPCGEKSYFLYYKESLIDKYCLFFPPAITLYKAFNFICKNDEQIYIDDNKY